MGKIIQRVSLGSTGQALIINQTEFEGGFPKGAQRQAIVPIDTTEKDAEELLEEAGRIKWRLFGRAQNFNGMMQAEPTEERIPEEAIERTSTNSVRATLADVDVALPSSQVGAAAPGATGSEVVQETTSTGGGRRRTP